MTNKKPIKHITAEMIVSTQPMTKPIGDFTFYNSRWGAMEPSAVERLAALEDPEMAEKIRKTDEDRKKFGYEQR